MAPDRHTLDAQQMSDEIVNECIENIAMCARSDFEGGAGTGEIIDNLKRLSIWEKNVLRAVLLWCVTLPDVYQSHGA